MITTDLDQTMDHSVNEIIGNAGGMRAFVQDVTSSERLTTLEQSLGHLSIGIAIYDDQFRLITWNEMPVDILRAPPGLFRKGMNPKELMPYLASIGFYDGANARSIEEWRQEMDGGELSREHGVNDGRILELRGSRTPDGGYVYITRDVSAQRQAKSVTRELAAIVESSEAAILSLSPAGVRTSWNGGAVNLYGYSVEESIGQRTRLLTGDTAQAEASKQFGESF